MSSVVKYTLARLLLFAVAWGLLYLVGARGLLAPALAVLISGLVSFVLLSRQRDEMSSRITGGITEVQRRIDAGAADEDR
ncbi:MAG: DUF4229 domain-containing protein, partial [Streptosporangiales bacterium]|nr:DUF4229 domain-containing protein [Streptosporangiales bacterium]